MVSTAGWATATSSGSCCPRRSSRSLGGASSLSLPATTASPSPLTARSGGGFGGRGKLGHGDEQDQWQPKKVEAFAGQRVVAVSAGQYHSIAFAADGAVSTWGKGEDACLGHGEDLSNQLLPKKVEEWALG